MPGEDLQQHDLFSYGSLEERVPVNHPLRHDTFPALVIISEIAATLEIGVSTFNRMYLRLGITGGIAPRYASQSHPGQERRPDQDCPGLTASHPGPATIRLKRGRR